MDKSFVTEDTWVLTEQNAAEIAQITGRPVESLLSGLEQAKARKQVVHISLHRPWWRET